MAEKSSVEKGGRTNSVEILLEVESGESSMFFHIKVRKEISFIDVSF